MPSCIGVTGATVGVTILDATGAEHVARTEAGITESPAGSGIFHVAEHDATATLEYVWDVTTGGNTYYVSETLYAGRGTIPSTFDPAVDAVASVTLVDTCTANSDMRGTDGANTTAPDNAGIADAKAAAEAVAAAATEARLAQLDAAELPAAVVAIAPLDSAATQAAAAAALAAYDPPTKAELDAAQAAVIAEIPAAPDNTNIVLVRDILQADVDVDTTAKTITWKHKDTGVTLYSKTYDDTGTAQGIT